MAKIKGWLIKIGFVFAIIITFGGYAVRQKRKAREAEEAKKEAERTRAWEKSQQEKRYQKRNENNQKNQTIKQKQYSRHYFGD